MADLIIAQRATVRFAEGFQVDGYLLPNEEFRTSTTGASELVGYERSWLSQVVTRRPKTLEALREEGYTGCQLPVRVTSNNLRGSSLVETISLDDLNALIAYAAYEGKKPAKDLSRALRKSTLVDYFRSAFGLKELTFDERRAIIEEVLSYNRQEVEEQFLPGDVDAYGLEFCDIFFTRYCAN